MSAIDPKKGDAQRAARRRYAEKYPERARESRRKYRANHPESTGAYRSAWRAEHPGAALAHSLLNSAVRRGGIVRPSACESCGKTCRPEGHHDDYARPLEVRWLCAKCHRAADDSARHHATEPAVAPMTRTEQARQMGMATAGEGNGRARLTAARVAELRERHALGETCTALAAESGLSLTGMRGVLHGRAWKSVPMPTQQCACRLAAFLKAQP